MATQRQLINRRDRAIVSALRLMDQAQRMIRAAAELEEMIDSTDRLGGLHYAGDEVVMTRHRITGIRAAARLRRVNFDRQVAEEKAAGGPEAYARQRGLT